MPNLEADQMEADQMEAKAEEAIAVHFANPLPGEWTGSLMHTKLVVIRKIPPVVGVAAPHRFEAIEHFGGPRATTDTAYNELSQGQDFELLTRWAQAWGRAQRIHTPAWVFVPVCEHNGQRFYAGVRPLAGQAFAHIVKHECLHRPQDWSWRSGDDGELLPELPAPTVNPDPDRQNTERFEWPDGSAIVAHPLTWDFGFHRDQLEDAAVIYECDLIGDEPRFAWPSDLG